MRGLKLDEAEFKQDDVVRIAGIEKADLQNWVTRDYLIPISGKNTGRGIARLYSARDAVRAALLGELTAAGIPVSIAAEHVNRLIEKQWAQAGGANWLALGQRHRGGEWHTSLVFGSNLGDKIDELGFQRATVLRIGRIVNRVLSDLEELRRREHA